MGLDVMKVDEGHNITMLWRLVYHVDVQHNKGITVFRCYDILDCYYGPEVYRIGSASRPLFTDDDPVWVVNITDIVLFVRKVEPSDAGLYTFRADLLAIPLFKQFV